MTRASLAQAPRAARSTSILSTRPGIRCASSWPKITWVNQKLAMRLLARMGYEADIAGNGLEAVDAVERQRYDLVLMDVQMPEMDGIEATARIVERVPLSDRPWIVAMTANAMDGDRERCIAAGMNGYVSKPIRVHELVEAILATPAN